MNYWLKSITLLTFGLFLANTEAATDPKAMLEKVANNITEYLEANKSKLASDENLAKDLVKRELLPYVDEVGLGRRVLARNWKDATDAQQKAFVDKFVGLVINTYAKGLAQYDGQTFVFEETEVSEDGKTARVKSQMQQKSGEPVKIDYMLKMPKGLNEWRVVDVQIEGISMVQSYRNQFAEQIKNEGLDSVIEKLSKNEIQLTNGK